MKPISLNATQQKLLNAILDGSGKASEIMIEACDHINVLRQLIYIHIRDSGPEWRLKLANDRLIILIGEENRRRQK